MVGLRNSTDHFTLTRNLLSSSKNVNNLVTTDIIIQGWCPWFVYYKKPIVDSLKKKNLYNDFCICFTLIFTMIFSAMQFLFLQISHQTNRPKKVWACQKWKEEASVTVMYLHRLAEVEPGK